MTKIYACLIGNWVCLNDDPDCVMGEHMQSPTMWWNESGDIYSCNNKKENSFYELDYVDIHYKDIDYRINPIFIQIITE